MRILFADDSMTAQNMGKKILTEAGYEVVAVSNGAAAVKKIAEQKPDIVILDIYMPGYTGLEVCDKLRSSVETLKTPVLLTVGKMEPYRPEDANRVRADGVIIKPFEASDLLAVIKKLEERVTPKTVAITEQTILLERPPALEEFAPLPSENHTEMHPEPVQNSVSAIVDVPDNMATSAAFSDLLGPEPAQSFSSVPASEPAPFIAELPVSPEPAVEPPVFIAEPPAPPAVVHEETFPVVAAQVETEPHDIPEFTTLQPQDVTRGETPQATVVVDKDPEVLHEAHSFSAPPPHFAGASVVEEVAPEPAAVSFPDTQPIPIYREPEPELELEPELKHPAAAVASPETSAAIPEPATPMTPGMREMTSEPYRENASAELENSALLGAATMPFPERPAFADRRSEAENSGFDSFSGKVEAQIQQIENIVSITEARHKPVEAEARHNPVELEPETPVDNGFSNAGLSPELVPSTDDDFEARVAAAMSAYDDDEPAVDRIETPATLLDELEPAHHEPTVTVEKTPEPLAFEELHSFEYSPPIKSPEIQTIPQFVAPQKPEPAVASVSTLTAVEPVHQVEEPIESAVASHAEFPHVVDTSIAAHPDHSPIADEQIIHEIEAQLPVTTAGAVTNSTDPAGQTQIISDVIHRVLERLKPQLIEEISKELKKNR